MKKLFLVLALGLVGCGDASNSSSDPAVDSLTAANGWTVERKQAGMNGCVEGMIARMKTTIRPVTKDEATTYCTCYTDSLFVKYTYDELQSETDKIEQEMADDGTVNTCSRKAIPDFYAKYDPVHEQGKLAPGMTKEQVEALLGPATAIDTLPFSGDINWEYQDYAWMENGVCNQYDGNEVNICYVKFDADTGLVIEQTDIKTSLLKTSAW